jgi:tripartite-type tricarboxylate transporter receptor subunit TctC
MQRKFVGSSPRFGISGVIRRRVCLLAAGVFAAALSVVRPLAAAEMAQNPLPDGYPDHAIRLVVPFPAGSAADVVARQIAPKLSEYLGQSLVVENRAGASGVIGAAFVAKAHADGYTLLFGTAPTNAIAPSWERKLPYDAERDFTAVAGVSTTPYVLGVSTTLPVKSVQELIAYGKRHPGELNYASTGNGTGVHLAGAFFAAKTGVSMKHVPYNGFGQLSSDLGSGTVQVIFYPYQGLLPLMQAGKLRVLASTGAKRTPELQQLPTLEETGLSDFALASWQGIYAPAGTSPDRVQFLYEAIRRTLSDPGVAANIAKTGNTVEILDPQRFAEFTKREIERYRRIVQASNPAKATE